MVRNHRGRGQVSIAYLVLLAVAILLVVVLVVRQVWRSSTVQVWVAKDSLKAGEKIDPSKLVMASVAKDSLPVGLATDPSALLGQTLQHPLEKGKPLTIADVTAPPAYTYLSDAPPEGRVVMTVRGSSAMPLSQLRYGDRLELISAGADGKARVVGHSMVYLGAMVPMRTAQPSGAFAAIQAATSRRSAPGISVVVAVDPLDVAPIAQAQAEGAQLSYVLHGRQELTSGRPVEIASHEASGQVELIRGASRETVK